MGLFGAIFGVARNYASEFQTALDDYNRGELSPERPNFGDLAALGYSPAQRFLKDIDECDRGLAAYHRKAYREAMGIFIKLADKGLAGCAEMAGVMYLEGLGTPINIREAIRYLKPVALRGRLLAGRHLAFAYAADSPEQDFAESFRWALWSGEKGVADSQCALGAAYYHGSGTSIDLNKAAYWFERAAQQEHDVAQLALGRLYEQGLGVPTNPEKALYWVKKAADNGNEEARKYRLTCGNPGTRGAELERLFEIHELPRLKASGMSNDAIKDFRWMWLQKWIDGAE